MTTCDYKQKAIRRFLENVRIAPGCWEWVGPVNESGYGRFFYMGKNRKAPRVAYQLMVGDIPPSSYSVHGTMVMHTCDNPKCVNPLHLRLGNAADNMADAKAKGRLRGNKHYKLDEEKVRVIRARAAAGESARAIAEFFGVHVSNVSLVVKRKIWAHIQ